MLTSSPIQRDIGTYNGDGCRENTVNNISLKKGTVIIDPKKSYIEIGLSFLGRGANNVFTEIFFITKNGLKIVHAVEIVKIIKNSLII
jgi:hypothetical protein